MSALIKKVMTIGVVLTLVFGIATLMVMPDTQAKGKPDKTCKWCPETIEVGGVVCTLEACGFDCVYSCPFPF